MKKYLIALSLVAACTACGEGAGGSGANAKKDVTQSPEYLAGKTLVENSGCVTCHKVAEQSTGPSFQAIAAKYPNRVETYELLSSKIIKGGSGNWGSIPMTPHPNITNEDAVTMVKYILSAK
jgi:cytochrome c